MNPIAKITDSTSGGGMIIATSTTAVLVRGKLVAAGQITYTVPGSPPVSVSKGSGRTTIEGFFPFDSRDTPLLPGGTDVTVE